MPLDGFPLPSRTGGTDTVAIVEVARRTGTVTANPLSLKNVTCSGAVLSNPLPVIVSKAKGAVEVLSSELIAMAFPVLAAIVTLAEADCDGLCVLVATTATVFGTGMTVGAV
jgi:hypothetical protein